MCGLLRRFLQLAVITGVAAAILLVPATSEAAISNPAYKGWGTVTPALASTMVTAYRWDAGTKAWIATYRFTGDRIYIYPWGGGWTWTWTENMGWLAMKSADLTNEPIVLKRPVTGLVSRSGPPTTATTTAHPSVGDAAVSVSWSELESADQTFTGTGWARIDAALADSRKLGIRLRIYTGVRSPMWVKKLGHAPVSSSRFTCTAGIAVWDRSQQLGGCAPFFWTTLYLAEYDELMKEVARRYESKANLLEVVNTACTTVSVDPFQRTRGDAESNKLLLQAGLTQATDTACQNRALEIHNGTFMTTRTLLGVSNWELFDTSAAGQVANATAWKAEKTLIDGWKAKMGEKLALQNNLLSENVTDRCVGGATTDTSFWCYIAAWAGPRGFQTESLTALGGADGLTAALDNAVAMHGCSLELPAGWEASDAALLATYDETLAAEC